eukprot:5620412-Alexandrium_andersonii.AAC.1
MRAPPRGPRGSPDRRARSPLARLRRGGRVCRSPARGRPARRARQAPAQPLRHQDGSGALGGVARLDVGELW